MNSINAYFATAISYDRKMFISLAPWKWINEESLIASNLAKSISGLYYKHILTIVNDDRKWRQYYKCNWRR
jgi:hypothetical protein